MCENAITRTNAIRILKSDARQSWVSADIAALGLTGFALKFHFH
jgi:hypothetical protein